MSTKKNTELENENFKKILVISLSGLGDTILATGLCQALRQRYKNAFLCGLTMWQSNAVVFRHLNIFDKVFCYNYLQSSLFNSLTYTRHLRKQKFDLSVTVFPSNRAHYNVLSWTIGAKYRLGHDYIIGNTHAYCRFLLTNRVPQSENTHNVIENMKLAHALGISNTKPQITVGALGKSEKDWAKQFIEELHPPFFGIHPGCSPLKNHACRRWPREKYAQLAKKLKERTGGDVLVFLGPDEHKMIGIFEDEATNAILVYNKSIEQVTALVKKCSVFICNDSSLGHLAAAVKIPVVMILGPTNVNYIRPWDVPYKIVSRNLPCSPCFKLSAKPLECSQGSEYACVRQIEVKTVLEECLSLLNETNNFVSK